MGRLRQTSQVLIAVLTIVGLYGCGSSEVVMTPTPLPVLPAPTQAATAGPTIQTSAVPAVTGTPTGTPTSSPGTEETPTPAVPATPFSGAVWRPASDFPRHGAFEVTSVAATAGGFVAVGFAAMPGEDILGRQQGIVWTSADGNNWQATVDPAFQFVTLEHIVSLGSDLYVFGTLATCNLNLDASCVEPPEAGWAVWRSSNDGSWERLPQLSAMQDGTVDGALAANGQLLAYGWTGADAEATLWASSDGVTWSQTTDLAGIDQVTAMAGTTAGLSAFGTKANERGNLVLIAAASRNGARFGTVDAPSMTETTIDSIAAGVGGSGVVAVGSTESDHGDSGVALVSPDGLAWTKAQGNDQVFADGAPRFIYAVPGGYVAVGVVPGSGNPDIVSGGSWFYSDASGWSVVEPFGERFSDITSSAVGVAGIVLFTVTQSATDVSASSTPAAWFAPMAAFQGP